MPWEAAVVRERAMPTLSGANDGIFGVKSEVSEPQGATGESGRVR